MGAGASASLPPSIDKQTARRIAGERFDEAVFDKAAFEGKISREAFLAARDGETTATSTPPTTNGAIEAASPFRDAAFPAGAKALGVTQAEMEVHGITWRRASELFEGAPLLPPKLAHDMVVQGALNDCYVAAGIALVASTGELSNAAGALVQHGEVEGQFVVTLVAGGGKKRVVVVDDQVPVSNAGLPLYAHARKGACLAFSLIEKALAKHYGSFAVLNGGNTSEALWDLTGCAVEDVRLDGGGAAKLSPSACATLVSDALHRGDLVACGHIDVKKRGQYTAVCEGGVRMNHAFAVVAASAKQVGIYNPMGIDDGYTNGKTDGAGTLTMTWSEFTKSFTRLQLCRRSSVRTLPFCKSWGGHEDGEVLLSWQAGRSAGGCTTFSSFRRNPMLRLPRCGEAKRKVTIEAVVGQRDRRGDNSLGELSYPQLGLCVVRHTGSTSWPCVTAEHYEVVAKSSAFWNKREVAATFELDLSGGTGAGPTYLVPSTFHPDEEADFWVHLRSDVPLDGAEWVGTEAPPRALWKGKAARNTVRLGVGGASAGRLCVFLRQTSSDGKETSAAADRVPLGIYLLDGDRVLQPAQFCKAGEVSAAFELDETQASSPHLSLAPCTFAADKGTQLEVEVMMMAPDAVPSAALKLRPSSAVDPKALLTEATSTATTAPPGKASASKGVAASAASKALPSKGGAAKSKSTAGGTKVAGGSGGGGMMGARQAVVGMADLYGDL